MLTTPWGGAGQRLQDTMHVCGLPVEVGTPTRSPSKELGRKVSPGGFPPAFINQNYFSSTHRAHFTQITAFLKKSSVKIKAGPEAKMKAVLLRGNLHRL